MPWSSFFSGFSVKGSRIFLESLTEILSGGLLHYLHVFLINIFSVSNISLQLLIHEYSSSESSWGSIGVFGALVFIFLWQGGVLWVSIF